MMIKTILMINLILTIYLMMLKSPLKSNLLILTQSILLTLMMNLINKTSWISFLIFILYISGLMIIFLYISSIAFNEYNIMNNYKKIIYKLMLSIMMTYMMKNLFIFENFNYENKYMYEDNFFLINLFLLPNNMMIYFIMMILFFMLIIIIWMLKLNKGPIRQKN